MIKTFKLWIINLIVISLIGLLLIIGVVIYIDPWFHFHGPVEGISYFLDQGNERYQNDGIVKNFEYNAIITGSSMIEATKTSEIDRLFNVNCVKVPFAGSTYKETEQIIETALMYNDDIEIVIRGLDYGHILDDKDDMQYLDYPEYLYDDNVFNDVNYLFNKRALGFVANDVLLSLKGEKSTSFDEYANWSDEYEYGEDIVRKQYDRPEKSETMYILSDEDKERIRDNIKQNVLTAAMNNPDVNFYYFFTPYSIFYFDSINQTGEIQRQLAAEQYAIELMLQYDNIHIYSFFSNYEMICELDNYRDNGHYSGEINSWIMEQMAAGNYSLNRYNYLEYCNEEYDFYTNYDYDKLFE